MISALASMPRGTCISGIANDMADAMLSTAAEWHHVQTLARSTDLVHESWRGG